MNIEKLKRLAEAATPGPWTSHKDGGISARGVLLAGCAVVGGYIANSRHIAAANPAAILELIRQRDELLAALKDAREMVSDWAGYASPYFQEKHDIDGDLKKLDDAITKAEG